MRKTNWRSNNGQANRGEKLTFFMNPLLLALFQFFNKSDIENAGFNPMEI